MSEPAMPLPAPALLAIAYAPKQVREQLRWLLSFDQRLGEIGKRAREPMIAQLRLAWWRDMLAKSAGDRPKGEPLLNQLGEDAIATGAAVQLVDAHELYWSDDPVAAGGARDAAIAGAYASWLGVAPIAMSSRQSRPLSILSTAAKLQNGDAPAGLFGPGIRLVWHALTGR
jgi:15-cis-phytoene synthase